MGIFSIANQHIRFAVKLATAIVLALFVGFHFQLETPRWAVLTAAIVAAGPAFAAGGEPYSGAIRYRGFLRIIGTFIGCIAGLVIIIAMIRAPLLMILVCCIWAGFCTWISSLVRIENSYAWGLAGYTALIIVITIQPEPLLTPQFAVERCSEIVIGIVCAIMADLLFSPRSIKQEVDRELESLLVAQYQLMQLCIKHGDGEVVDKAWGDLVRRTLHSGHAFLAVDGLDFRQWCNGDDCGRDVTGNAFAESTHGGDRLYLRDAGRAAVRAALLFGDYP